MSDEASRRSAAFLRQLSLGLSSYRLYPGALEQPGFVAAVDRIRATAAPVVPVAFEVNGPDVTCDGAVLPDDDATRRLALALYERGAQQLEVTSVPSSYDLAALYAAISLPVAEVSAGAGVGAVLRRSGVGSITVEDLAPQPGDSDAQVVLNAEQRSAWSRIADTTGFAAELELATAGASGAERARLVHERIVALVSVLPPGITEHPDLYRALHMAVGRLEDDLRRELVMLFLERLDADPLAERLLGTMTDTDLARTLADVGAAGDADAVDLAERLVERELRHADLGPLTAAAVARRTDASAQVDLGDASHVVAAAEMLGRALVDRSQDDLRSIREEFPDSPQERDADALAAFRDYLYAERDLRQLSSVLGHWAHAVRDAVRMGDAARVGALVGAADTHVDRTGVPRVLDTEVEATVTGRLTAAVDHALVRELVESAQRDGPGAVEPVLAPLGEVGVAGLFDALAGESDRGVRAVVIGILAALAPSNLDVIVARLRDPRWFVARNAVTILRRAASSAAVEPLLEATRHEAAPVRREAVLALIAVAGAEGVTHAIALAQDPDLSVRAAVVTALSGLARAEAASGLAEVVRRVPAPERRRAIEALASHPAPEALTMLDVLAHRRGRPRLPGATRRLARELADDRRRG